MAEVTPEQLLQQYPDAVKKLQDKVREEERAAHAAAANPPIAKETFRWWKLTKN